MRGPVAYTSLSCGLPGINTCPLTLRPYLQDLMDMEDNMTFSDLPNIETIISETSPIGLLNEASGLPGWIGLSQFYNYLRFNSGKGFVMAPTPLLQERHDYVFDYLMEQGYTSKVLVGSFYLSWNTPGGGFQD